MENKSGDENELNTLEDTDTTTGSGSASSSGSISSPPPPKKSFLSGGVQAIISRVNVYLILFVFIVVVSLVVVFIGVQRSKKEAATPSVNVQQLSKEELEKISSGDAKVGDPKQTLNIESNAIFSGKVLVRDSLDVAGTIKVGGNLSLPGLNVAGSSTFDQLQANKAAITGDIAIQGQLSVQKNITTSGGATFGGPISAPQITIQSLQINGDLTFSRHIDAGGGSPGKSDGGALGSGGTSSVSGTDTAGTATINTGGSPGSGCFLTITFANKFNTAPHVVITPVGSAAAGLNYYINRSNSSFSICTTNPPPAGQSFSFDYIVID